VCRLGRRITDDLQPPVDAFEPRKPPNERVNSFTRSDRADGNDAKRIGPTRIGGERGSTPEPVTSGRRDDRR
jgi:hypothetical protein